MGKDFQPYLPVVMPAVMKTASIKPEVAVLDSKLTSRPSSLLAMYNILYVLYALCTVYCIV
jgi:hypothetical protein